MSLPLPEGITSRASRQFHGGLIRYHFQPSKDVSPLEPHRLIHSNFRGRNFRSTLSYHNPLSRAGARAEGCPTVYVSWTESYSTLSPTGRPSALGQISAKLNPFRSAAPSRVMFSRRNVHPRATENRRSTLLVDLAAGWGHGVVVSMRVVCGSSDVDTMPHPDPRFTLLLFLKLLHPVDHHRVVDLDLEDAGQVDSA